MITILVVDDNDTDRRCATQALEELGRQNHCKVEIVQAADGVTGMWALQNRCPDIVVCDLDLKQRVDADGRPLPQGRDIIHQALRHHLPVVAYYGDARRHTWATLPRAVRKAQKGLGPQALQAQVAGLLAGAEKHHGLARAS